jgi:GNAT superfamily N-acetyltransferase
MLRSQGYITKLYDLRDKLHSEKLSFETMYQNIDEEINPDVLDPRFNHKQEIGEYTYTAGLEPGRFHKADLFVIRCYDGDKMIGQAKFYTTFGDSLVSALTTVQPEYQKQGIASTMYAYARMLGNTIEPSASQLPPGKKMWKAWKKSGDAQYLMREDPEESNHWYDAGVKDAQRDAKLYPDRVVKKLNPRTRLKTMQDKRARHPEEVEQYSLGYKGVKQGVAKQAVTETAEELQELTQFSKGMADFLAKSYEQYIKNPQTAKYVQQQISQPITDGATYRALMPTIGIVSVPGADTYTSPGLELAKKFVNMVVAYFPAPGDADYNGFSEAAPAVYDARSRTVVINKDYLSDPTYLASTIAHEVQHGIDDLKSRKGLSVKTDQQDLEFSYYDQGKAFKQKQSAGATNNAQKYQSYLSMPHEVNARFTEVINDIKQRIEKEDIQNIGSAGLSELARSAFKQHYMHEVFPNGAKDPGYKRLLSRVYAWLSKYYNDRIDRNGSFNPQPATPVLEEQGVAEAFDTPLPITWEKGMHGDVDALAKLPDGSNLSIMFNKQDNIKPDDKTWMVEFYRNNSQEVTGEGDAQKVFSTVLVAIQQFITKYKPLKIYFSASKLLDPSINYGPDDVVPNPESRAKLYDRLVQRYAKTWGYRAFRGDTHASVMYELSRIPKQKAVGEDYTMQFAAEKTPPVSPYAGVKDNQYRGSISEEVSPKYVTRVDMAPITDFMSGMKTYYGTDDWHESGLEKKDNFTQEMKGLYAGEPHRTALYASGNASKTRFLELNDPKTGQPVVYFDKKDIPRIRNTKTYVSVFDASRFKKLPTGEYFSENPGKPLKQEEITDPFKYMTNNGWVVRVTDDIQKEFKKAQQLHKAGKIDHYGGENLTEAADKKISFKVQKGKGKFSTTLTVNNFPAGIYQYDSNTGRSIAEVYPEFKGKGLGKLLVLHAIYTAAKLGLDFQEDESRTAAYDNVLDSLSSNGYIVDDDGYWYVTGDGEQYLKQALNEASGYIPSEKEKNDPRFKTALTVDVHPDSIKKNAKAFYWNTSRAGIPPTVKANGKI